MTTERFDTPAHALDRALEEQRAGRPGQAVGILAQLVRAFPGYTPAYVMLGGLQVTLGRLDDAVRTLGVALLQDERSAAAYSNLGNAHRLAGRLDEAILCLRRALQLEREGPHPQSPAIRCNHASALDAAGRREEAAALYKEAIRLFPDSDQPLLGLAEMLGRAGNLAAAISLTRQAVRVADEKLAPLLGLSQLYRRAGWFAAALDTTERALSLDSSNPRALFDHGLNCLALGRTDEALRRLDEAKTLMPRLPGIELWRGRVLLAAGRARDAARIFIALIRETPGDAGPYLGLGQALRTEGKLDDALKCFAQALDRDPALLPAEKHRAETLLVKGDHAGAWPAYARLMDAHGSGEAGGPGGDAEEPFRALPPWCGEPLEGATLVVDARLPLIDAILFARFLPALADGAGRLEVRTTPALAPLFARLPGVAAVRVRAGAFDAGTLRYSLAALPGDFRIRPDGLAPWQPYLGLPTAGDPSDGAPPADDPAPCAGRLRVAVQGRRLRDRAEGWFADADALERGPETDWTLDGDGCAVGSPAELLALLDGFDALISPDHPLAHLAAAAGKPVLVALTDDGSRPVHWVWPRDRADSAWYPTARIRRSAPSLPNANADFDLDTDVRGWLATLRKDGRR